MCISQDEEEGALPARAAAWELGQPVPFRGVEVTAVCRPLGLSTGRCWEHKSTKPKQGTGRLALEGSSFTNSFSLLNSVHESAEERQRSCSDLRGPARSVWVAGVGCVKVGSQKQDWRLWSVQQRR